MVVVGRGEVGFLGSDAPGVVPRRMLAGAWVRCGGAGLSAASGRRGRQGRLGHAAPAEVRVAGHRVEGVLQRRAAIPVPEARDLAKRVVVRLEVGRPAADAAGVVSRVKLALQLRLPPDCPRSLQLGAIGKVKPLPVVAWVVAQLPAVGREVRGAAADAAGVVPRAGLERGA